MDNKKSERIGMSNEYLEARIRRMDKRLTELVVEFTALYNKQQKQIRALQDKLRRS